MALASSVRSTCQSGLCPSCCHKALPLLGCFVAKCLSGSSPGPALCPAAPPPPLGPEFLSSIEASGRDWLSQEGQAGFVWNWATRGGDWGGLGGCQSGEVSPGGDRFQVALHRGTFLTSRQRPMHLIVSSLKQAFLLPCHPPLLAFPAFLGSPPQSSLLAPLLRSLSRAIASRSRPDIAPLY